MCGASKPGKDRNPVGPGPVLCFVVAAILARRSIAGGVLISPGGRGVGIVATRCRRVQLACNGRGPGRCGSEPKRNRGRWERGGVLRAASGRLWVNANLAVGATASAGLTPCQGRRPGWAIMLNSLKEAMLQEFHSIGPRVALDRDPHPFSHFFSGLRGHLDIRDARAGSLWG
jgi:hypothetical protein